MSVPGFAVSPDEVRSREAELPARPRCQPRSLSNGRANACARRSLVPRAGAGWVPAQQQTVEPSRGPAWASQGLSPRRGQGPALKRGGAEWLLPEQVALSFNPFSSSPLLFLLLLLLPPGARGSPVLPAACLAASSSGELPQCARVAPGQRPRFLRRPEHPAQNPAELGSAPNRAAVGSTPRSSVVNTQSPS